MSGVTRYDPVNGMYHCSPGKGGYVLIGDYERLEQECEQHKERADAEQEAYDGLNRMLCTVNEERDSFQRVGICAMEERDAAIKQVEGFRVLLFRCQGNLDPHRHAVLWGDLIEALR